MLFTMVMAFRKVSFDAKKELSEKVYQSNSCRILQFDDRDIALALASLVRNV